MNAALYSQIFIISSCTVQYIVYENLNSSLKLQHQVMGNGLRINLVQLQCCSLSREKEVDRETWRKTEEKGDVRWASSHKESQHQ